MVEGPGATRNGRKIIRAVNHRVIDAEFQGNSSVIDASVFTGRYLADTFVVGKELFLIFATVSILNIRNGFDGDPSQDTTTSNIVDEVVKEKNEIALRLHFGMVSSWFGWSVSSKGLPLDWFCWLDIEYFRGTLL